MKFFALSSRTTGPNILVPIGSPVLLSITAAFVSNFIKDPSFLLTPFAVLTTTALSTSPFFTLPLGIAVWTLIFITSPILAYLLLDPPSTLMHWIFFAPLLSAAVNTVCT
jgi:hypothetical protein